MSFKGLVFFIILSLSFPFNALAFLGGAKNIKNYITTIDGSNLLVRGVWAVGETYQTGNLVTKDGQTWIALQENTGVTPVEGVNWTLFADKGPVGDAGADGADGTAASLTIGTVTTGAAGSSATVENVGTSSEAVLDFSLPQGATGAQGVKGDKGDTGETGATGATGSTGPAGADGANGVGVPTGGTTGQVLSKINATNYNTQWIAPPTSVPTQTGHSGEYLTTDGTNASWAAVEGSGTVTGVTSANAAHLTVANGTIAPVLTVVSAPKLTTARTIAGKSFDGTANITLNPGDVGAASSASTVNGHPLSGNVVVTPTDLGLVIGTNVQAYDADLTTYAGITPSANVQTLLGSASYAAFKTSLSLGNVDNTSDANKPVSSATTTQLNLKAPLASPTFTGTVSGITKAMVGLGSVDNTTDVGKPVSTATQTALNLKANLADPTFTGTPTLPTGTIGVTQTAGDSSTKLATTAFVTTADNLKAPLDNPTFTTGITTPLLTTNAADGTHFVRPYNSVGFSGTPLEGMLQTTNTGSLQLYHETSWVDLGNGSMNLPGAGIAVSTGSAWTTSLVAPSGILVGTTDAQDLTNKTLNKVTITAPTTSATLTLVNGSTLATSGAYSTTLTASGTTNVTLPTTGTLATLAGTETLTNKTLTNPTINNPTLTTPAFTGGTITTAEVNGSAAASLTANQVSSTFIYNTGQTTADVALTLPTAASGLSAIFTVGTARSNKWGVLAGTNDKIYLLASDGTISAGSDNGYARMTAAQVGQSFACWTFKTDAYDWMCKAIAIGTSTFAAN